LPREAQRGTGVDTHFLARLLRPLRVSCAAAQVILLPFPEPNRSRRRSRRLASSQRGATDRGGACRRWAITRRAGTNSRRRRRRSSPDGDSSVPSTRTPPTSSTRPPTSSSSPRTVRAPSLPPFSVARPDAPPPPLSSVSPILLGASLVPVLRSTGGLRAAVVDLV
jgi:hypothetical protein